MEDKNKKNKKVEIINFNDVVETKEVKKKLTEEEKEEIKKKLTRLLFSLVIFGTLFITILFSTNLFKSNNKKDTKEQNTKEETVEEAKKELPTGEIELSNSGIEKYKNILTINQYDTLFNPTLKNMFLTTDFSKLDNNNKLYLASKSETFIKYLTNAGMLNHEYECNKAGVIEFDSSVMKKSMEEVFGPNVTYQNDNFNYMYYINNTLINVYDITFSNNKYKMTCNKNYSTTLDLLIQEKTEKITNNNNKLIFEVKAVFITKDGVYSNPKTTNLITNDSTTTYNTYMAKGTTYKFVFNKENDNYYLSGIEK